jgi:two-component system, OmpR family, response regulator
MNVSKILMIEDDPDIRRVAVMALKFKGGWTVVTAEDGIVGLEKAASEKPDVILLDSMMPRMDGPETLKRLKADEALKGIPVVFLTAKSQKKEIEAGLELGAIGYLVKPFDPMTLAEELKRLVDPL